MSWMRAALIGLTAATLMPAAAGAQSWGRMDGYEQVARYDHGRGYDRQGYRGRDDDRRSYRDGRGHGGGYGYGAGYGNGYGYGRGGNGYRSGGGRYRCDRGTGGTIIGAIAGGLLGNTVAGRGDRGVGTVVGAGVGALAGRSIDRNC